MLVGRKRSGPKAPGPGAGPTSDVPRPSLLPRSGPAPCLRPSWPRPGLRGFLWPVARPSSRAAVLSSGPSTSRVTSPRDKASSGLNLRPVNSRSKARDSPAFLGSVWVPPAAGTIPNCTSGMAKTVPAAASRRSQKRAISNPEPMQKPWTPQTTGFFRSKSLPHTSRCQRTSRAIT